MKGLTLKLIFRFCTVIQVVNGAVCTGRTVTNAVQTTVGATHVQRTTGTVTAVLMAGWGQSVRPVRQTKKKIFCELHIHVNCIL